MAMRSQRGAQDVRRRNGRASHAHHPNHRHSRASAHGRRLSQHPARRECRRQGLVGRASAALPEGDLLGAEEIPALKRGALAFVFGPNRKGRRAEFRRQASGRRGMSPLTDTALDAMRGRRVRRPASASRSSPDSASWLRTGRQNSIRWKFPARPRSERDVYYRTLVTAI